MKWECALLQRWLPEYPDGDLPAWVKRWLNSHVARCSACRQELADLREIVAAVEATPRTEPSPDADTRSRSRRPGSSRRGRCPSCPRTDQ